MPLQKEGDIKILRNVGYSELYFKGGGGGD